MKTQTEQKRSVSDLRNNLRNEIANGKDVDERQVYQLYAELDQLDKIIKSYQSSLYYGKSLKHVTVVWYVFLLSIILMGLFQ